MLCAATATGAEEQRLDRELVEECLAGDADQFRHLIRRYERVVIAHLRVRLRDACVEDATQETFVRAYRNLGRLRSPEAFFSWLLGIADRVAREFRRRQVRQEQVQRAYSDEQRTGQQCGPERETDVRAALASLSEPLRQVVLLRFFADQSCADIAWTLGIPVGTVTKRLSRAYEHIRRRTEP